MFRLAPSGSGVASQLSLTKKESELLNLLRQNAGQCLSRDHLLQTIWGYGPGVRTRTLDVHIQRLRRKMRMAGMTGEIQTILRAGYCWQPVNDTRSVA